MCSKYDEVASPISLMAFLVIENHTPFILLLRLGSLTTDKDMLLQATASGL